MLIAIDHGNKQMKTLHCPPFVSGLTKSSVKPFGKNILKYQEWFYMLSNERIPYMRDKTEDESFFVLTLFAIARELEKMGGFSDDVMRIQLAVGLPPVHYGAQNRIFTEYFAGRDVVQFDYQGKEHAVYIEDVRCYPQAYAAAVTRLKELMVYPRALIVDIDAVLKDKRIAYPPSVVSIIEQMARDFVDDLINRLRELMLDLSSGVVVFVGGGAILLQKQIEASGKIGKAVFVEDINANARGYELLYQSETMSR